MKKHSFTIEVVECPISNTTIEVNGLDSSISEAVLKMYFESKMAGSRKGAVKKCSIINEGTAHVTFHDSQGM